MTFIVKLTNFLLQISARLLSSSCLRFSSYSVVRWVSSFRVIGIRVLFGELSGGATIFPEHFSRTTKPSLTMREQKMWPHCWGHDFKEAEKAGRQGRRVCMAPPHAAERSVGNCRERWLRVKVITLGCGLFR
jgi:hypothetical protein